MSGRPIKRTLRGQNPSPPSNIAEWGENANQKS